MHDAMAGDWSRVLIAGGAGFLGSHLCERMLDQGTEVLCLDNLSTGSRANLDACTGRPGFTWIHADVTDPVDVPGPLDLVLHLASPASPVDYLGLPVETLLAGSAGTRHLLDLAAGKQARFVLASTSEVYGEPLEHPQRESYLGNVDTIGPRSVYDEAKRYAEALTTAYRRRYGTDTAIARIFNTYGPRMRPHDGRVVPTLISQALRDAPLTIAGDGSQTRSFCYVDDLVDGICALAASGWSGPVNLGNPEEITVLELAHRIREITGSSAPIRFVPRPEGDPSRRRPDIGLAIGKLSWEPRVSVDNGLRRTAAWFAEHTDAGCTDAGRTGESQQDGGASARAADAPRPTR
ncbi:UDP-glucuronic acid decarboxylase family protein [Kitasatospora sp. NPDC058444]|uniref:UDP-glucuronic acid decarboxylase family protein n=1 Tax=Kitasatospora sp. NPDC058444 TaxID=3346504 RepID=UPI00365DDCCA